MAIKVTLRQSLDALINAQEFEAKRQEAVAREKVKTARDRLDNALVLLDAGKANLQHDTQFDLKMAQSALADALAAISQVWERNKEVDKLRKAIRIAGDEGRA